MTDETVDFPLTRTFAQKELMAARCPTERNAALTLAAAQRDLRIAWASSPARIAEEEPGLHNPEVEYAAWVARMVEHEQWARETALRSVVDGYAFDRTQERSAGPLGHVTAAAVRRARAAIAVMTGPDESAARAMGRDVLSGWPEDDRLALAELPARDA